MAMIDLFVVGLNELCGFAPRRNATCLPCCRNVVTVAPCASLSCSPVHHWNEAHFQQRVLSAMTMGYFGSVVA